MDVWLLNACFSKRFFGWEILFFCTKLQGMYIRKEITRLIRVGVSECWEDGETEQVARRVQFLNYVFLLLFSPLYTYIYTTRGRSICLI